MKYLLEHPGLAIVVVCVGCFLIGLLEHSLMRDKKLAAMTWFFGLSVLCAFVACHPAIGVFRLGWAALLFVFGIVAIVASVRTNKA
jgi:hypothetical protein